MCDNYSNSDQYKKVSFSLFKEIKLILKKHILYPIFGIKQMQKFTSFKNSKFVFFEKNSQVISSRAVAISVVLIPHYKDVYYLRMPKVACSSIRKAILHVKEKSLNDAKKIYQSYEINIDYVNDIYDKTFFTFVRNPFSRIVSCYTDRVLRVNFYRYWYDGQLAISNVANFKDFVKKIVCIPDNISDGHFCSQSYLLTTKDGKEIPNCYIGHFETLAEDFEPLRQKYGFASLEQVNKSSDDKKDWRDYYDEETAKLVYERYQEDFERFGYEGEYQKLLSYLKDKQEQRKLHEVK